MLYLQLRRGLPMDWYRQKHARVLQNMNEMKNNYKIMDLDNPMISKKEEEYLDKIVDSPTSPYLPDQFVAMYNQDKLGGMIRNVEFWVKDIFEELLPQKQVI